MRVRLSAVVTFLSIVLLSLAARTALAAPEAKILRIDPRAAQANGIPILSTVVEVAQRKRLSEATSECAYARGNARMDCLADKLSQPRALFQPFDFPPKENAIFTVLVDGADVPAKFESKHKWGESQNVQGVGTAWLILLDAGMGGPFGSAKEIATAFINSMGPQDIANVMVVAEGPTLADSKWKSSAQKAELLQVVNNARAMPREGRARPLFTVIRNAATDAFKDLGNVGADVQVPLHQAMVVLSNGSGGADALTNGAGATQLAEYLSKGRFPEDNTALPKMPLPVISIYHPTSGLSEEFIKNAQDFMTNLANPEIGGYFNVARGGNAQAIVNTVRDRFNQMFLVRWRVSCVAPTVLQTFKLFFKDVQPPIAPDGSFKDVPVGIDPTTWPLDIDVAYTTQMAKRDPVHPGGEFTIYGSFCWGSNKERAQVYFVPANTAPPAAVASHDIDAAKRAQQQLIAMKMDGRVIKATDTSVTFEAPASEKLIVGKGDQAVARVVVYDSGARRMSGVTASTILTLKAGDKPLPVIWLIAAAFGGVVILLLLVAIARGGGGKRRGRAAAPAAPPAAGPAPVGGPPAGAAPWQPPGGGASPGYGSAPPGYGAAPQAYGAPGQPAPQQAYPQGPAGTAVVGAPGAGAAPNQDFLYGGKPPQFGLTTGQPQAAPPPPNPYGGGYGGASRATLSGAAGVFTVLPGMEMRVGRDAAQCQIAFSEPRVSGVHATVKLENGQLYVRDERSNNGTHVNGARIDPGVFTLVPSGSMLRFGPVELAVRLE